MKIVLISLCVVLIVMFARWYSMMIPVYLTHVVLRKKFKYCIKHDVKLLNNFSSEGLHYAGVKCKKFDLMKNLKYSEEEYLYLLDLIGRTWFNHTDQDRYYAYVVLGFPTGIDYTKISNYDIIKNHIKEHTTEIEYYGIKNILKGGKQLQPV